MKKEKKPGSQASIHSSGVGINDGGINVGDGNGGGCIATVNNN